MPVIRTSKFENTLFTTFDSLRAKNPQKFQGSPYTFDPHAVEVIDRRYDEVLSRMTFTFSEPAEDHAEEKRNLDVAMNGDNAIVGRRIGFIHLVIDFAIMMQNRIQLEAKRIREKCCA